LPFCGLNVIDHYFCDLHPLFKLACTDTFVEGVVVLVNSGLISIFSFLLLVSSYVIILFSLRNHSAERGGARPCLPVPLTSQWSSCSLDLPPSST
jgi:olfactory receptor